MNRAKDAPTAVRLDRLKAELARTVYRFADDVPQKLKDDLVEQTRKQAEIAEPPHAPPAGTPPAEKQQQDRGHAQ